MIRTIASALMMFGLVLSLDAACGEAEAETEIKPRVKKVPPPAQKLNDYHRAQRKREVAQFAIAAIVKVIDAGVVFEEKDRPQLPNDNRNSWRMQQFGVRAQRVRCEVVEVMRGLGKVKEIEVLVRHFDFYGAQSRLRNKDPKRQQPKVEDAIAEGACFKGEKYLVLLALDENLKPGKGRKGPVYSTVRVPAYGAAADLTKLYREMGARIRRYQKPATPTREQLAAADKHIKSLESKTYAVREKAHRALLAIGPMLMKHLKATQGKTKDLEVRLRCAKLLDDMKPLPGGRPEDWAGKFIIKKVEEKKEEDEKDEEKKEAAAEVLIR
jgi:hypothetical protein